MSEEKEKATSFADEMAEMQDKVNCGKMTHNQMRIKLGLAPVEGGDEYVILESRLNE